MLLMCREKVFINAADVKRRLTLKHKEHFASAEIINIAFSLTKTAGGKKQLGIVH